MPALDQLNTLLAGGVFAIMLVFTRVGVAMLNLPGFGDTSVPAQARLFLALAFSVAITPILRAKLPAAPDEPALLILLLGSEVIIGLFIGTVGRVILTSLETAGQLIGHQTGFSIASVFNPQIASAGSLAGSLLSTMAVVLLFVTDLHHMLLRGLLGSYDLFPAGGPLPIGDLASVIAKVVAASFTIGVQLSAPFIIVALMLMVGLGLIARMMPQIQIFFVAQPIQLALGIFIFAVVLPAMALFWMTKFQMSMQTFLSPGTP
ncbi:flagellar biosynthetic protein FliR [Roseiterribacter gracilis]|uniref:Flagellar biosynthetic protein FliR n=1 Tax=Roseiterribacter gracilis TaxID=2812848 RepID=A0A8S8XHQ8_9PROT|nr:flagellar biosynthetic protein FliR [Rhodospirillales bacterium TMPK1]